MFDNFNLRLRYQQPAFEPTKRAQLWRIQNGEASTSRNCGRSVVQQKEESSLAKNFKSNHSPRNLPATCTGRWVIMLDPERNEFGIDQKTDVLIRSENRTLRFRSVTDPFPYFNEKCNTSFCNTLSEVFYSVFQLIHIKRTMKRSAEEDFCESDRKKSCIEGDGGGCVGGDSAQQMIRPSEVPIYLRESEFYMSLNTEDDEEFYVPANLMKEDMTVKTMKDACDLLHTIRFWGLDVFPKEIALFALMQPFTKIVDELSALKEHFPLLETLLNCLNDSSPRRRRLEAAMQLGVIEVLQHLDKPSGSNNSAWQITHTTSSDYSEHALGLAAEGRHLDCLQHALRNETGLAVNYLVYYQRTEQVFVGAVANGHLQCIDLLHEQYMKLSSRSSYLTSIAAANDQFQCLQLLHTRGCAITYNCVIAAAERGSLQCLQYLVENKVSITYSPDVNAACIAAARHGHFECLKYLHEHNYPLADNLCKVAATKGNARCLAYAHSHGCTLSVDAGIAAAMIGSQDCLKYFFENGGERHFLVSHAAALNGHLHCLQYACEHSCSLMPVYTNAKTNREYQRRLQVAHRPTSLVEQVAFRKHWDCVLYLILQGCPLTRGLTAQLARKHKDNMLQLVVERGCEVAVEVGVRYARIGNLDGLNFALEHGCGPSLQIPIAAARKGHYDCLVYAHSQGCPWSEKVCVAAARGGHLNCLQYAREHGCPWDHRVRAVAKKKQQEEIVKYVEENSRQGRRNKN